MPITDFFEKNPIKDTKNRKQVPDGIWSKCVGCRSIIYEKELNANSMVCTNCDFHHPINSEQRIAILVDEGSFKEIDAHLKPKDFLKFTAAKSYKQSIDEAGKKSNLNEGLVGGTAKINNHPVILGVMDFRFIGGSMGSVVGEKITRLAELAAKKKNPLILVCASGGARMQEGMISLMQMAKTSAAIAKLNEANVPYFAILTNPTLGGVTASFATLADIIIAEPKALIGFAGPRVIEKTIRERLPEGFQTAEFLKENGMIDLIISRTEHKQVIAKLLDFLNN